MNRCLRRWLSVVVTKYQKRISGPILDRIDINVKVPRVDYEKLSGDRIGAKVQAARAYHRTLKLVRTIADLVGSEEMKLLHLAEELQCRSKLMMGNVYIC